MKNMLDDLTRRRLLQNGVALSATSVFAGSLVGCSEGETGPPPDIYQPTARSLRRHPVPTWFRDARFGIFVHWGPYSVPAFAPTPNEEEGKTGFKYNGYAEWYRNTMLFEDGPTAIFHRETYGADYAYERFGETFNDALDQWDPDEWARTFAKSGARYVVLVTKHHDGFLLWPSATPNPQIPNWGTRRDVVGELAEAVRGQGLRFGVYYSGGVDWTFRPERIDNFTDLFLNMPGDRDGYTEYANAQIRELIDRYRPDYLWNDIGYPNEKAVFQLLAHYYNAVPGGLTNDRWISLRGFFRLGAFDRPEGMTGLVPPKPPVWDVRTPEYTVFEGVLPFVWETTRGLGRSFGYNRAETEADLLSVDDITAMLAQAASYNGNVLLNVGPRGDAQIDPPQADRLRQVGDWLATRSAAVQNTRPIEMPPQDVRVGAVENGDRCFLILLEKPSAKQAVIQLPSRLAGYANARAIARTDYQVSIDAGKLTVSPTASWGEGPVVISLSV